MTGQTAASAPTSRPRKPSLRMRKRACYQAHFGHRELNDWNGGDLPAPFADGDLLWLPEGAVVGDGRLHDMAGPGWFIVCASFSVDEGDAWYFRVTDLDPDKRNSDRLHVAYADRCTWDEDVDYMAPFELVDTSDTHGACQRLAMLAAGWTFESRFDADRELGRLTARVVEAQDITKRLLERPHHDTATHDDLRQLLEVLDA